jgi:amino acid adenylation domain-containing protein
MVTLSALIGPNVPFSPDGSIVGAFAEQTRSAPEQIAVVADGGDVSYGQLAARVDAIVGLLREAGVQRGAIVGIGLCRSVDLIASIFAVLACGAAYVPLDPTYPAARLDAMCANAEPRVILVDAASAAAFAGRGTTLATDAARSDGRPWEPVSGDELAYICYTSGSTGQPKGVEIRMKSLTAFVAWAEAAFSAEERSGVLFATSVSFDVSVFELFGSLCTGGTLVLAGDILDAATLAARDRVRMITATASGLAALVEAQAIPPNTLTIMQAGERMSGALARDLFAISPARRLINACGATEDTVYSTMYEVQRSVAGDPPIGIPIADRAAYVCDGETLALVPEGTIGELCYAGIGVARGYHAMREATERRFVPNPHARNAAESILYRSGDLARINPDGDLEHCGRLDDQVKIRGYRIELGDVAAAYTAHPAIREVTIESRSVNGDARLVAYAVPREVELAVDEVQSFVARSLPSWMVPSLLIPVREFARTPAGKLDRKALPEPVWETAGDPGRELPSTPTERVVAAIWARVIGLQSVYRDDDFFDLGGHSLTAARAATQIETALGATRTLASLFTDSRLSAFCEAIDRSLFDLQRSPLVVVREADDTPPIVYFGDHHDDLAAIGEALARGPQTYGLFATTAPTGLDGDDLPQTIESMAEDAYRALRIVRPWGPYRLAGRRAGALAAYAVAARLANEGEQIASLLLVDASFIRSPLTERAAHAAPRFFDAFYASRIGRKRTEVVDRLTDDAIRRSRLDEYYSLLAHRYQPPNFAGNVTIVETQEIINDAQRLPNIWWKRVAAKATIISPPGYIDAGRCSALLLVTLLYEYPLDIFSPS